MSEKAATSSRKAPASGNENGQAPIAIDRPVLCTSRDLGRALSAVLSGILNGTVEAIRALATANVAGKLIRNTEAAYKYGTIGPDGRPVLILADADPSCKPDDDAAVRRKKRKLALLDELARLEADE